jgi:glycosyltransferase involved in cell wall biosynthesis
VRISVAMAVRNGERFLQPLLDSLLRQTVAPFEVVVTDDASEDSTPALLAAFAAGAPFPVRIERFEQRGGHVAGFMHAAGLCRGDAVAFCDGDDVWLDEKLETMGRALDETGAALALHTSRVVDGELRDLGECWPRIERTRTVPRLGLTALDVEAPGMAMLFPRPLLDVADFAARPPSRYGRGQAMLYDEWALFVAGAIAPIVLLSEPLALYRRHGANDSQGPERVLTGRSLRPSTDHYRDAARHTAACADYLDAAAAQGGPHAEELRTAAAHYRHVSEQWALRVALYEAPGRRRRARTFARLLANGAYGRRSDGVLGRAALGKDLAAGVALRAGARGD